MIRIFGLNPSADLLRYPTVKAWNKKNYIKRDNLGWIG